MTRQERPQPQQSHGGYAYTLSSDEPVSITVRRVRVTDVEVEEALRDLVSYHGGTLEGLTDEWVTANVRDVATVDELRPYVRRQLEAMYAEAAERSKPDLCVRKLAERLEQSVPEEELARARQIVRAAMERDLSEGGLDVAGFLSMSGMSDTAFEAMVDQEALALAEREAALEAFVAMRGLTVDETEYPGLLGLSPADTRRMLSDMRANGQEAYVRRAALHAKAMRTLAEECMCSYETETEALAQLRVAQYREAAERMRAHSGEDGPSLRLV